MDYPMTSQPPYKPTWRKPIGVLLILALIIIWSVLIANQWERIGALPIWLQSIIYLIAGVVWLLPLKPLMIWMETGSFKAPK
jgi:magnesium-transporting ATPase (P-type)